MKTFMMLLTLATLTSSAFANEQPKVLVCEGDNNGETLTVIDDGFKVGILKGKVDIAAGSRGNALPKAMFSNNEVEFKEVSGDDCEMTVTSPKGSLTLGVSCNGEGPGSIKSVNIPSIQLQAENVALVCRFEQYTRSNGRSQRPAPQAPVAPEASAEASAETAAE